MSSPEFTSADSADSIIFAQQIEQLQEARQEPDVFRARVRDTLGMVVDGGEAIMTASSSQAEADRDIAYDIVLFQLSSAMDYPLRSGFARHAAAELYASSAADAPAGDEQSQKLVRFHQPLQAALYSRFEDYLVQADFTDDERRELDQMFEGDMIWTAIESVDEASFFLSERAGNLKKEIEESSYYAQQEVSFGANEAEKNIAELGSQGIQHMLEEIKNLARTAGVGYAAKVVDKYSNVSEAAADSMRIVLTEYIVGNAQKAIDNLPLDRMEHIDAAYGDIASLVEDERVREVMYAALDDTVLKRALRLCEYRQEKAAKDFIEYYSSDSSAKQRMLEVLDAAIFKTAIGLANDGTSVHDVRKYVGANASSPDAEAMMFAAIDALY